MKRGIFRIERARVVHEGAIVRTEVLQVRTPDGELIERQVVRHPGAVAVVAIHEGCVVLVKQYRVAVDAELIEIPAGKLDVGGELPEVAARRELIEEVGLDPKTLVELGPFLTAPGFCDEQIIIYATNDCVEVGRRVDGIEEAHSEILRVPVDEIGAWLVDGTLTDSKTLIGLFWAKARGLLVSAR